MTSGLREKVFTRVFRDYLSRKHGYLGRFFVSGFVILYITPSCQVLKTCSSGTVFAGQGLAGENFFLS